MDVGIFFIPVTVVFIFLAWGWCDLCNNYIYPLVVSEEPPSNLVEEAYETMMDKVPFIFRVFLVLLYPLKMIAEFLWFFAIGAAAPLVYFLILVGGAGLFFILWMRIMIATVL